MPHAFKVYEDRIERPQFGKIAVYRWERQDKEGPLCLILHGLAEYGARYKRLVSELTDTGWSFASFDLRGHGHSDGERMRMDAIEDLLGDVEAVLDFIDLSAQRRRPIVILGHSFGGLLASLFCAKNLRKVSGLVLSSPALGLYPVYPCMTWLIKLLYRINPRLVIPKPVVPEKLTHDVNIQKEYLNDPFIYKFTGVDFLFHMLQGMEEVKLAAETIQVPTLMILAEKEWVTDNRTARAFFDKIASRQKQLYLCKDMYHETFNESRRMEPIGVLKDFLQTIKISL